MPNNEWLETFSSNLIYWLGETCMTQRDLAKYTGLSEATISNYVKGKQSPSYDAIRRIVNVFGIRMEDLTG